MENFKKLDYILTVHMSATEVTQAFGFKSENVLSKMRNGKSNISKIHIDSLERYFNIPTEVFNQKLNDTTEIDELIEQYQLKKKQEEQAVVQKQKILTQLELQGLIPPNIFQNDFFTNDALEQIILDYKKSLRTNSSLPYGKYIETVFGENIKLFEKLKGTWYGYIYPSNSASAEHGVWEVKTIIGDDYSVVDEPWGNRGYLQLGKHESLIIKESYDNDDLTIIRFVNRQVPSGHFRFVIISNQNNTHNEMVNFGFFSKKKYSPDEAKEILGDIDSKQLKLDLDFNDRLNERAIVPQ